MNEELFQNAEEDFSIFEERYRKVFYFIGQCLTRYQTIEDTLYDAFLVTATCSNMMAASIFEVANSVESKLKLITAATIDRDNCISDLWSDLRPRIKAAADLRNQIAHATPVQVGRGVVVEFDHDSGESRILGYRSKNSDLQLEKRSRGRMSNWTLEDLQNARDKMQGVWVNLITFNRIAAGQAIPAHFKKAWDHPTVQSWVIC